LSSQIFAISFKFCTKSFWIGYKVIALLNLASLFESKQY